MSKLSTIELQCSDMIFSAGHFTIFSATERENLHGHNYSIAALITTEVGEEGLSFDYRFYKQILYKIRDELKLIFLLPTQSKYLKVEEDEKYCYAYFADEKMQFLKRDVLLLPLSNITVETLSSWICHRVVDEAGAALTQHRITALQIKVSNMPGQSGSACWIG